MINKDDKKIEEILRKKDGNLICPMHGCGLPLNMHKDIKDGVCIIGDMYNIFNKANKPPLEGA